MQPPPQTRFTTKSKSLKYKTQAAVEQAAVVQRISHHPSASPTTVIYKDLVSLAELVKHYTTSIALAMKQDPKADYNGANVILDKLLDTVDKLSYATKLLSNAPLHGVWEKELQFGCILPLFESLLVCLPFRMWIPLSLHLL